MRRIIDQNTANYVGIDFEFGGKHAASIISYGLAFSNGEKQSGFVQLHSSINVITNHFAGVTQEESDSGLTFPELHDQISELPENTVLVAHSLRSERRAFLSAQRLFALPNLPLVWLDALPLAQKLIGSNKNKGGGGVKSMADFFEMDITHHDPADDASVSLETVLRSFDSNFNFVYDTPKQA